MSLNALRFPKLTVVSILCCVLSACGNEGGSAGSLQDNTATPDIQSPSAAIEAPQTPTDLASVPETQSEQVPEIIETPEITDPVVPDEAVAISNEAPVITAPATLSISNLAKLQINITVMDPDNDDLNIDWAVTKAPENGDLVIDISSSIIEPTLSATQAGLYSVTISANDGHDTTSKSIDIEIFSAEPRLPDVEITAVSGNNSYGIFLEQLVATHAPLETEDTQPVRVRYYWYLNGVEQTQYWNSTIDRFYVNRGESYTVLITLGEGEEQISSKLSAPYVVGNSPPRVVSAGLLPLEPTGKDTLHIDVGYQSDFDGDPIELEYEWYRNGEKIASESDPSLPPGYLVDGDTVYAKVIANDGFDSSESVTDTLTVANTPPSLVAANKPTTLSYGVQSQFHVAFVAADGSAVPTSLVSAPDGLSYDADGYVSWTPTPIMFSASETYFAYFSDGASEQARIELVVENQQHKPVIARSGIEVPKRENNLFVGNFDDDAAMEIMTTDSSTRIFTVETRADRLVQDWLYPYDTSELGGIVQITPPVPGSELFFVVHSNSVSQIDTRDSPPKTVYESEEYIRSAIYADLDGDGQKEMVLLIDDNTLRFLEPESFVLLDTIELVGYGQGSHDSRSAYTIYAGNVDDDNALEVITSAGEVIDGVTRALEWQHADSFGNVVAIGDINGNGENEILAAGNWKELVSFDARLKSDIAGYGVTDICSILISNVDDDVQEEIITGDCQHGQVRIYDAATGTLEVQHEFGRDYSGNAVSLAIGDVDTDGINEIVWGKGINSTGQDTLHVGTLPGLLDTSPENVLTADENPQLDNFKVVGRTVLANGSAKNLFMAPSTRSGYDGARFVSFGDDGDIGLSDVFGNSYNTTETKAVFIDSDEDSVQEILLATIDRFDGNLQHLRSDDFSLLHSHASYDSGDYSSPTIFNIVPATLTDGTLVIIGSTSENKIEVYDFLNQSILWTSAPLSTPITAVDFIMENGALAIVVATTEQMSKWIPHNTGYIRSTTTDFGCKQLQQYNDNGSVKFACIAFDYSSISDLKTVNAVLEIENTLQLNKAFTAMGVITGAESDYLLIGVGGADHLWLDDDNSVLEMIDPKTGLTLWGTEAPIGMVNGIRTERDPMGLFTRVLLSTGNVMYATQH